MAIATNRKPKIRVNASIPDRPTTFIRAVDRRRTIQAIAQVTAIPIITTTCPLTSMLVGTSLDIVSTTEIDPGPLREGIARGVKAISPADG